ncbi:gas vesicle accessory protein GvpU [Halobacillus amylolyticus]|uniref:Gas vesicle protein GvpU n=1 Tax=Halobacillus amylolyticus TaxID=2932259 RepID=A0ABY4HGU8_9BACI|nr:gas vesicle accessory protein GvpU [Halobacillus amylolyticus]UOR13518.1 gas vesicle protein GvpU [Halobacillus amylolyticus]
MSEAAKDNILEFFVKASNKHGFELDISLLVNGAVVSGTMVSAKEYFENLSESFEDGSDLSQELSAQLAQAGESAQSSSDGEAYFIHLKNVLVYCGDSKPTPSKGKILWRGKLSEVDSFFLGKISEPKNSSNKKA